MKTILLVLLLCALAAAGCSGDDDDDVPTPTVTAGPSQSELAPATAPADASDAPSATASTGAATDDMDAFREFAGLVAGAVAQRDAEFFASRVVEVGVNCEGSEVAGPCSGKPVGTVVRGLPGSTYGSGAYGLTPQSEYAATMESRWNAAVQSSDDFGPSEPRLFAVGHESTGLFTTYQTLIGQPQSGTDDRLTFVQRWQQDGGDWQLVGETAVLNTQGSKDWLSGGCGECYDYFELWEE